MYERSTYGPTRVGPRRVALVLAVAALTLLSVACEPVKLGGPGAAIGNVVDPVNCPQHQPVPYAPCGPQPLVWAAMNGPYDDYNNGDPYSTKCVQGGGSGLGCTTGNPLYRTTGFAYAIDVAAGDVGRPLTLEAYDIGVYPRRVSSGPVSPTALSYDLSDVVTTSGSATITSASGRFTSADVGQPITGLFCSTFTTCTISSVPSPTTAVLNTTLATTGTFGATIGYDCNTHAAPFNTPAYSGMSNGNCQTGDDSDGQNIDVQVYDNNGSGGPSYATPLPGCHFSHTAAEMTRAITTYKNAWAGLCTFTPTATGIHAFRVRNSGIDGMVDTGGGINGYSLRVTGATNTALYPIEDHNVFVNAVGATSVIYVANVAADNAGKKLMVDVYDPGDGIGTSNAVLQLRAPPGGTTATPALTGLIVPAPGIATSCRYNATPSATEGPATPDDAPACGVTTHTSGNNIYNGKWLRYEVTLDPAYTCSTDCRWTLQYNWGTAGLPTDRIVFSAKVVN